jgi:hypothetical protein
LDLLFGHWSSLKIRVEVFFCSAVISSVDVLNKTVYLGKLAFLELPLLSFYYYECVSSLIRPLSLVSIPDLQLDCPASFRDLIWICHMRQACRVGAFIVISFLNARVAVKRMLPLIQLGDLEARLTSLLNRATLVDTC